VLKESDVNIVDISYLLFRYPKWIKKCKLLVVRKNAHIKHRKFIIFDCLGTSAEVGAFTSTIDGMLTCILGRVLFRKNGLDYLPLNAFHWDQELFEKSVHDFTQKLIPELFPVPSIELKDFPLHYGGSLRKSYIRAVELWYSRGDIAEDAHIRMFPKFEKDIRSEKQNRIMRAISPPGPVARARIGAHIKPKEHLLYLAINRIYGYPVVAKGMTYDDVADVKMFAWRKYKQPVAIDIDVEKCDASITVGMLTWVFDILVRMAPIDERNDLKFLLNRQMFSVVKGRTQDGHFSYVLSGTLTSGQAYTSLTAILIILAILYPHVHGMSVINMGDDTTIIGEKADVYKLRSNLTTIFSAVNMIITISEVWTYLERSIFCQTQCVNTSSGLRTIRTPHRALTLDSVCLDNLGPVMLAAWCRGVGLGGLANHGGIPVMQNFYRMFVRAHDRFVCNTLLSKRQRKRMISKELSLAKIKEKGFVVKAQYSYTQVSCEDRISFFIAVGMTPQHQIILEKYYDSITLRLEDEVCVKMIIGNAFSDFYDVIGS